MIILFKPKQNDFLIQSAVIFILQESSYSLVCSNLSTMYIVYISD